MRASLHNSFLAVEAAKGKKKRVVEEEVTIYETYEASLGGHGPELIVRRGKFPFTKWTKA